MMRTLMGSLANGRRRKIPGLQGQSPRRRGVRFTIGSPRRAASDILRMARGGRLASFASGAVTGPYGTPP